MEEIAKGDAILEDAMEEVKRFNNSEEILDYYKINEKLRRSECNALRKEGLEEGKEEGRNEVLSSFVEKNLAQKNEDDYIVVQLVSIFDLSKSEAKAFLKEVKLKKQQR